MPRPKKGTDRSLSPDVKGYYRPYLGARLDPNWSNRYIDQRFNLGKDLPQAQITMSRLVQLWNYIVATYYYGKDAPPKPYWGALSLWIADEIIAGHSTITVPRKPNQIASEYAAYFNRIQRAYPFVLFVPAEAEEYREGVTTNKKHVEKELIREQEFQIRQGMLASKVVVQPVQGTLHQALDAYSLTIDTTGERLKSGVLKGSQQKRKERATRFKTSHANLQLALLNLEQCSEMVSHWRNRPVTKRGNRGSGDDARHHLSELFRFFRWLDSTEQFGWQMPRGLSAVSRRIAKFENERSLSAITKSVYTVEQLAIINSHATPLERLALYVGLNCAMGAAELGRLLVGDIVFKQAHPYRERLRFESTESDTFIRYFRPKTDVFGEWLLWQPVVDFLPWGIERAKRINSNVLFVSENGKPMYVEESKNAQAGFQKQWNDLLDRVNKSEPTFPRLPFGTLRDTLPDILRQEYEGGDELASLCLNHGAPSKADMLLEGYSNKPFGRLHKAIRELFDHFKPIFEIENPTDCRKHYLPIKTHETIKAMRRAGNSVATISKQLGVHPSTVYRSTESHVDIAAEKTN